MMLKQALKKERPPKGPARDSALPAGMVFAGFLDFHARQLFEVSSGARIHGMLERLFAMNTAPLFNYRSRRKLKPSDAARFAGLEPALFADLSRVVCSTGVLPEKELHECWQMAERVHASFPRNLRIVDLAAGHGLLAWILALIARYGAEPVARTAVAIDITRPPSAALLAAAITAHWPELAGTVHYVEGGIDAVTASDGAEALFVAAHACGSLSDRVLLAAIRSGSAVAIMPCCHSLRKQALTLAALVEAAGLPATAVDGIDGQPASIDQLRIDVLTTLGYERSEARIPAEISAFNRIIMGRPPRAFSGSPAGSPVRPATLGSRKRLGEIRAYETVRAVDVSDRATVEELSKRPSREWRRTFDLSYWVDDDAGGAELAAALTSLAGRTVAAAIACQISICDRHSHPVTQRRAFTYRIEVTSATAAISKDDAMALRQKLRDGIDEMAPSLRGVFVRR